MKRKYKQFVSSIDILAESITRTVENLQNPLWHRDHGAVLQMGLDSCDPCPSDRDRKVLLREGYIGCILCPYHRPCKVLKEAYHPFPLSPFSGICPFYFWP